MKNYEKVSSDETEARIAKAIALVKSRSLSGRRAANLCGISNSTLQRRLKGGRSIKERDEQRMPMKYQQEAILAELLSSFDSLKRSISGQFLSNVANNTSRFAALKSSQIPSDPISEHWGRGFQRRHSDQLSKLFRQFYARSPTGRGASYRSMEHDPSFQEWIGHLTRCLRKHRITPDNCYNMSQVTLDNDLSLVLQDFSIFETVCADDSSLPPFIVSSTSTISPEITSLLSTPGYESWSVVPADPHNGWSAKDLGLTWLTYHFEPLTASKAQGQARALFVEGNGTLINMEMLEFMRMHNILLFLLPVRFLSQLEPLQTGILSQFQKELRNRTNNAAVALSWPSILNVVKKARDVSITPDSIDSSWFKKGLLYDWSSVIEELEHSDMDSIDHTGVDIEQSIDHSMEEPSIEPSIEPSMQVPLITSTPFSLLAAQNQRMHHIANSMNRFLKMTENLNQMRAVAEDVLSVANEAIRAYDSEIATASAGTQGNGQEIQSDHSQAVAVATAAVANASSNASYQSSNSNNQFARY